MTIEQLREKIVYRTNKMNWCISVGRETQAQWNREQIARMENQIEAIERQEEIQRRIERNINRGRGNDVQPTVRNTSEINTDEDFDYV